MKAHVGDRLILEASHIDEPRRIGVIQEIHDPGGKPPYLVRWLDGHETLVFPGPDARVEPSATTPDN